MSAVSLLGHRISPQRTEQNTAEKKKRKQREASQNLPTAVTSNSSLPGHHNPHVQYVYNCMVHCKKIKKKKKGETSTRNLKNIGQRGEVRDEAVGLQWLLRTTSAVAISATQVAAVEGDANLDTYPQAEATATELGRVVRRKKPLQAKVSRAEQPIYTRERNVSLQSVAILAVDDVF